MEQEKDYAGIWKKIGCFLSAIAILGILAFIIVMGYQLFTGA